MDSGVDIVVLGVDISVSVLNALVLGVDISVSVAQKNLGRRHSGPEEAIEKGEEYRGT